MFLCELLLKSLSVIIASVPTRAKFNRFSRKCSRKIKGRGQETEGLSSHHGNLVRWVNRMVAATDKNKKGVTSCSAPQWTSNTFLDDVTSGTISGRSTC